MNKGQKLKCSKSYVNYLTSGLIYCVESGVGDASKALGAAGFEIKGEYSFTISDDDGDCIFQTGLSGSHGDFEVIN